MNVSEDELKALEDRERALRIDFERYRTKAQTERVWLAIIGLLIIAWLGVESYFQIPERVREEVDSRIETDTQLQVLKSIETERNRLLSASEELNNFIDLVLPATFEVRDTRSREGFLYFKFDTAIVDAALGSEGWDRSIVTSYNHRTGIVRPIWLWRERGDLFPTPGSAGRYINKSHTSPGDWQNGDSVTLLISNYPDRISAEDDT